MSLAWGWPIALAALAALALPVLLHLDRRRTLQVVRFAALQWLGRSHPARRTWRLTEWLLLALRLLLVASVVAWLARPLLHGGSPAPQRWVVVVPGVATTDIVAAAPDAERGVWLAPGFPRLDVPAGDTVHDLASLLREFDASLPPQDALVVVVPPELGGLDAAPIELSRPVEWRIASPDAAAVRDASSTAGAVPRRQLALRYERADDPSLRVLRAAVAAWRESPALAVDLDEAEVAQALPRQVDAILWLGATPSADALQRVEAGATLVRIDASLPPPTDDATTPMPARTIDDAQRVGTGRRLDLGALTTLDPEQLRSGGFARMLHVQLFGTAPAPARAHAVDVAPRQVARAPRIPERPLRDVLGWAIAALFLLERVLANGPRLARAP